MVHFVRMIVCLAIVFAYGCKSESSRSSNSEKPAAPSVDELARPAATASHLVSLWTAAQNRGAFGVYSSLYADTFTGLKRGKKTVSFDRAQWLKDRKTMFSRRIRVSVSELKITERSDGSLVRFVQDWQSGEFRDRGAKELSLVKVGGAWRIEREEMLDSEKQPVDLGPRNLEPGEWAMVIEGHVHLHPRLEGTAIAKKPELLAGDSYSVYAAGRRVANPFSHAENHAWHGAKLAVFGAKGKVCDATPGAVFDSVVAWPPGRESSFLFVLSEGRTEKDFDATAKRIFDWWEEQQFETEYKKSRRVSLAALDDSCGMGVWAQKASAPDPRPLDQKDPDKKLEALAQQYVKWFSKYDKAWDSAEHGRVTWVYAEFVDPASGRRWLAARVHADMDDCDETAPKDGFLTAIWEIVDWDGRTALVRLTDDEAHPASLPEVAWTGAGDDAPTFLTQFSQESHAALWRASGTVHRPLLVLPAHISDPDEEVDCPDEEDHEGE